MSQKRRKRLWVDYKLQGSILIHTGLYWLYCLLSVVFVAACWILCFDHPSTSGKLFHTLWLTLGPAVLGSLVLLPLVLMDCLRLSNRFVGPMRRFRRTMKEIGKGESVAPIKLRDGDYWTDFADEMNRLIEYHNSTLAESPEPTSETDVAPEEKSVDAEDSTDPEPIPSAETASSTSPASIYSDISV